MSGYLRHFSGLSQWTSKLTSRLSSGWFGSSKGTSAPSGAAPYGKRKWTDYKEMDRSGSGSGSGEQHAFEMAPSKSIRTFVHAGGPGEVEEEDGIHLRYNVEQRSVKDGQEQV